MASTNWTSSPDRKSQLVAYRKLFEKFDDHSCSILRSCCMTRAAPSARTTLGASAFSPDEWRCDYSFREQRKSLIYCGHHVTMSNMAQQRNLMIPKRSSNRRDVKEKKSRPLMLLTYRRSRDERGKSVGLEGIAFWHLYYATQQYLETRRINAQIKSSVKVERSGECTVAG